MNAVAKKRQHTDWWLRLTSLPAGPRPVIEHANPDLRLLCASSIAFAPIASSAFPHLCRSLLARAIAHILRPCPRLLKNVTIKSLNCRCGLVDPHPVHRTANGGASQ
eukprot:3937429-Rhodomonas_salina.2